MKTSKDTTPRFSGQPNGGSRTSPEIEVLGALYCENDYPSDRLLRDPRLMEALTREFSLRCGSAYTPEEVGDELMRLRKNKAGTGGLPRIGRSFGDPKFRPEAA